MKIIILFGLIISSFQIQAQSLSKMPDSVKTKLEEEKKGVVVTPVKAAESDDAIKARLIKLALKNPELQVIEASLKIAEINYVKSKSTLLSSVSIGANINEFVVSNSAVASLFPKYNLGVSIPLDLFAKAKAVKQVASQDVLIAQAQKAQQEKVIKMEVLSRYENYKEKKELLELQKISMEDDFAAYQRAQQQYADDDIELVEMNKLYKAYINEKATLTSLQKNFNVAIIELESILGVSLEKALNF